MLASDQWAQGKDRRANTDASNFASGTGTSFANSQYGDPNGDQRSKSPEQLADFTSDGTQIIRTCLSNFNIVVQVFLIKFSQYFG